MNLDDLMEIWKSQDTVPLHEVNKTLLHQALRQDEVKLQNARRRERRNIYRLSTGVVGGVAFLLVLMIHARGRYVLTGWDYVMGIGGAAAALFAGGAVYVGHLARVRREQRFGESLRDQINRRIAQLDDAATGARRRSVLILVLMGVICPTAILHLGMRINDKSLSDVSYLVVALLIWCFWAGARGLRRSVQRAIPRKQRLEALLNELDSQ